MTPDMEPAGVNGVDGGRERMRLGGRDRGEGAPATGATDSPVRFSTDGPPAVLIVDDEAGVRDLIGRWLTTGGYDVTTAGSAEEALILIVRRPPAVALCDIRMPGHDGVWLARQIRYRSPDTAIIMATGVQGDGREDGRHAGVSDYLTKPFGRDRLREAVLRGLEWHHAARDSRDWRETLQRDMDARANRLCEAVRALRIDGDEALDAMLAMVTITDREAYAHASRVVALSVGIGCGFGLARGTLLQIERAALLHDLGKLAVPDAILRKPAPLTADELALVRRHPILGAEIIEAVGYLADAAPIVRSVHERMDGDGYPDGVPAEDVPLASRIIAVAEAYDVMTRARVFRDAITPREAILEIARCAGTQFDPSVVAAFRLALGDDD